MKQCDTTIGKKLGVTPNSKIENLPLTSYGFYKDIFFNPRKGDLMFPFEDYRKIFTSGSMGKPKTFLIPMTGIWNNLRKTGLTMLYLFTHDGEKIRFKVGDTMYRNAPPGSYYSTHIVSAQENRNLQWVKQTPPLELTFQEKVDYFVEHHEEIDIAYMTVTTLLDEVYPRIGKPFKLKGFITSDRAAGVLKDEIKKVTGSYPKVIYGSTETFVSAFPSIEHPGSFILDWRIVYPEFIPEDSAVSLEEEMITDPPETVSLLDVKPGKRYQYISTPYLNDMTRYIMPDILECISIGDKILGTDIPVFKYYSRLDRLIAISNFTRISEDELMMALKNADIPWVDFTARSEIHGVKEYLVLYLELSEDMNIEEITDRIHQALLSIDRDWRDLTEFLKYIPLKIQPLSRGTFQRYLATKSGVPRITRIGMREDRLETLLKG